MRNEDYDNVIIYKDKTKKCYDQKIMRKEFKAGYLFLLYNFKLKQCPGKLKSIWSGPYAVVVSTPFGAIALKTDSVDEFKVNSQRVKHYLGGNMNEDWIQIFEKIEEFF